MILIVFALPEESQDLRRLVEKPEAEGRGASLLVRGKLSGRAVTIAHTGMGAAAAARQMPGLLAEWKPELVIGAGFAGGLVANLEVGDVVCDLHGTTFLTPEGAQRGTIAAATEVLETAEAKASFGRRTGAVAVDMESGAASAACAEAGVPYLMVRAISDRLSDPLPVPTEHWFDLERQRPRPGALVWYLLRHPGRILPFARFVRGLGRPRAALAKTLAKMLHDLR